MNIRLSKAKYCKVASYFKNYEEFKTVWHETLKWDVKPMSIEDWAVWENRMRDIPDSTEDLLAKRRIDREKLDICAKLIYNII